MEMKIIEVELPLLLFVRSLFVRWKVESIKKFNLDKNQTSRVKSGGSWKPLLQI